MYVESYKKFKSGFTLVELLVAMTLFITVVGVSGAIFIRSLRSQRILVDLIAVNDNASLAIEQMAREIRLGSNFTAPAPGRLDFVNAFGQTISYRLNSVSEALERQVNAGTFEPITGANVRIKRLTLTLVGETPGDKKQPRIIVRLSVGSAAPLLEGFLTNLQTTLSARELDS